ncbi:MAG: CDP-diacylglycerol--glycerol-3-phosphate 3-phosphatidyltransferase [Fluviibacter phosphoraccumulans]
MNLPLILTWARIACIPLLIVAFVPQVLPMAEEGRNTLSAILFIFAAITDWLDGYLARRWNQTSNFGAFLDPVADKLIVSTALILLVADGRVSELVTIIIIGREITISALREWMASMGKRKSVAVNMIGKFKTAAQLSAIPMLLQAGTVAGLDMIFWGTLLIWVAAVLTLWSMAYYLYVAWPDLKESD